MRQAQLVNSPSKHIAQMLEYASGERINSAAHIYPSMRQLVISIGFLDGDKHSNQGMHQRTYTTNAGVQGVRTLALMHAACNAEPCNKWFCGYWPHLIIPDPEQVRQSCQTRA